METHHQARAESAQATLSLSAQCLSWVIRAYQLLLSPWLGHNCRFEPSCSHYALEALRNHGSVHGSRMALFRLCKCHPWHPGGYDPVPPACSIHSHDGKDIR